MFIHVKDIFESDADVTFGDGRMENVASIRSGNSYGNIEKSQTGADSTWTHFAQFRQK